MKILAYRIYPEPDGFCYAMQDLQTEKQVEQLFDYCQIWQAQIYKSGWVYLITQFGYTKLFKINQKSGWFDSADLFSFKQDIQAYLNSLPQLEET